MTQQVDNQNSVEVSADAPASKSNLVGKLLPIAGVLAVLGVVVANGWHKLLSFEALREHRETLTGFVSENFLLAILAYVGVYVLATASMMPGALWITIAGGFLFGLAGGSVATTIGATLGASLLFFAARTAFGEALRQRAGPFLKKMETGFQEDAVSYMFALRFLPVVPFPVANIAPALLGARYLPYALTTFLGVIPGVIAYTWLGAGLGATFDSGQEPDIAGVFANLAPALVALGVVSLIPVAWKKFGPSSRATPAQEGAD